MEFFRRHRRIIGIYAHSLAGQDAEDLVHDVLVAMAHRPVPTGPEYVLRAMRNRVISRWRRPTPAIAIKPAAARPPDDDNHAAAIELLQSLPPADRELVLLRVVGGLSFPQIAEILGDPLGSVSSRYTRLIQRLRQMHVAEEATL